MLAAGAATLAAAVLWLLFAAVSGLEIARRGRSGTRYRQNPGWSTNWRSSLSRSDLAFFYASLVVMMVIAGISLAFALTAIAGFIGGNVD